jgi:hypothetical protein
MRAISGYVNGASMTLRREQSLHELERLVVELDTWRDQRIKADCDLAGNYRGQYETQRETIVVEVRNAIEAVREETAKLSTGASPDGQLYERLARIDRQVIWIRYAWGFYRSPFDQRDDPLLKATLKAADEVAWSCFKPLFNQHGVRRPPAPLPCIDFDYAPSTVLTSHAHVLHRELEEDDEWQKGFKSLPVPLLRLPPTVVSAPWNLTLIAHEVGHAVYADVEPDGGFRKSFPLLIEAGVHHAGASNEDKARWRSWATEIFADCYSVLMLGPWALWSIGQLEYGPASKMSVARRNYPAANVRLYLLAQFAAAAGLKSAWDPLAGLGISEEQLTDPSRMTMQDAAAAREVAKLIKNELPLRQQTLAEAVTFDLADFQTQDGCGRPPVDDWSDALLGKRQKTDEHELRTARLVSAAAVKASMEIAGRTIDASSHDPPAASEHLTDDRIEVVRCNLEKLRDATVKQILASAEAGKRSAKFPMEQRGRTFANHILQATDVQLFTT